VINVTKDFTVAHANQQRICLKCASDWEKNASQKPEILKIAFGGNFMCRTQNFSWFSRIACLGGGRVINKDRGSTVSKTARRLGISYGIRQGILEYAMDLR
jgi:hypothetical protein